jgi:hypothetical protein
MNRLTVDPIDQYYLLTLWYNSPWRALTTLSWPVVIEPWAEDKKRKLSVGWRCHQLLSGFLAKGHLLPSVTSVMSVANDKDDNEMILGTVQRSPDICLTAEENPRKPQLGDRLMKGLCDKSSPQMGSLSSK